MKADGLYDWSMDEEHNDHNVIQTGFTIETGVYSGPLDLLIDLIEKRKLLIKIAEVF